MIKIPIDYKKYPANWEWIRSCILTRAGNRCELCNAENGKPHWKTGSLVVLTVAHIDQDVNNNKKYNLLALCQRCHLKIDMPYKIKKRKEKKEGGYLIKQGPYLEDLKKDLVKGGE